MDVDTKYKRWGWGALIGLIAVILIAGLIVAVSLSSPKKAELADDNQDGDSALIADDGNKDSDKKTDESKNSEKKTNDSKKTDDSKKSEDKKSGSTSTDGNKNANGSANNGSANNANGSANGNGSASSMPKTGPAENLMSVVVLAMIAGLAAHNVMHIKKCA